MRVFEPWEGSKYRSGGLEGVRVLILGESHYGDVGTESAACTIETVKDLGQERRNRFFTVTQKLVSGINPEEWVPDKTRVEFWESVAFYNYVQSFPGDKSRMRPTQEMWANAATPLLKTLQELRPQVMVVLGLELQSHLPEIPSGIRVCNVPHPSSRGFQYERWQPVVKTAISAARNDTQPDAPADGSLAALAAHR